MITKRLQEYLVRGSLRNALLVRSLLVLGLILLLIGVFQYFVMKDFLYRNRAETLQAQMMSFPRFGLINPERFQDPPTPPTDSERPNILLSLGTSLAFITSEHGFVDLGKENGTAAPQLTELEYAAIQQDLKSGREVPYLVTQDADGKEQIIVFRMVFRGFESNQALVQMGVETSSMQEVLLRQLLVFSILSVLALFGGFLLYLPVLRRTLVPFSNVVAAVERTDAGNLGKRLPVEQGQREIDLLARSFNNMLARLEQAFASERQAQDQMKRFLADASHELRTPLTSIHGFVEVLLRGAGEQAEQRKAALLSMHSETKRINALVEDLFTLAKLDQTPALALRPALLGQLIADMRPQLELLAGDRQLTLDIEAGVTANCDPDKLKQALLNLFFNAVQHTDPTQGRLAIKVAEQLNCIALTVVDNGAGIQEEHQAKIFERFYRIDGARTRKDGGAGLGLAITQAIVEAHQGIITLTSTYGQGATFQINLPKGNQYNPTNASPSPPLGHGKHWSAD